MIILFFKMDFYIKIGNLNCFYYGFYISFIIAFIIIKLGQGNYYKNSYLVFIFNQGSFQGKEKLRLTYIPKFYQNLICSGHFFYHLIEF